MVITVQHETGRIDRFVTSPGDDFASGMLVAREYIRIDRNGNLVWNASVIDNTFHKRAPRRQTSTYSESYPTPSLVDGAAEDPLRMTSKSEVSYEQCRDVEVVLAHKSELKDAVSITIDGELWYASDGNGLTLVSGGTKDTAPDYGGDLGGNFGVEAFEQASSPFDPFAGQHGDKGHEPHFGFQK